MEPAKEKTMATKKTEGIVPAKRLTKADKEKLVAEIQRREAKKVVTEMSKNGPVDHVVEPKDQPKAKKEPKVDTNIESRNALVSSLEKAGFKGEEKSGWIRVQVKDTKVSISTRGPQVHFRFAGSEMDHAGFEVLSEDEAKKRHLGSVRRILWLDRQTVEVVKDIAKMLTK